MANKLGKNNYIYSTVLIVGTIVLSLIIMVFIVKPNYSSNKKLKEEVTAKREKATALKNNLDRLKVYKEKEEELIVKRDKVLAALPESRDIPGIFIQFEKMVSNTGATVKNINKDSLWNINTTTTQNNISGITIYNYNLEATTSTYESFRNIIQSTELARRITDIKGFSIYKNGNSFDLTFNLETFAREDGGNK